MSKVDLSKRPFTVVGRQRRQGAQGARPSSSRPARRPSGSASRARSALQGKGVSACAVCDGAFFRNQDVIVVGGGDTAMEESMYLSGLCKSVTLVHRREEFRASKDDAGPRPQEPEDRDPLQRRGRRDPRRLEGRGHGRARQEHQDEREDGRRTATGFFVAIGHTPNTDLFKGQLELHDNGYIKTQPGTARTRTSPASSPAATCRTSPTARR